MKLVFEPGTALCYMRKFEINGIEAESSDFGEQYDRNEEEAEEYGCGDMQFTRSALPTQKILDKYHITEEEFNEIGEKLEEALSFGRCGWCV